MLCEKWGPTRRVSTVPRACCWLTSSPGQPGGTEQGNRRAAWVDLPSLLQELPVEQQQASFWED